MVSGAAFGQYLDFFFGYLEMPFMDDFDRNLCSCAVYIPHSPQTSCFFVADMDGGIEPSNTHICYPYVYLIPWLLCFHLCLCLFFVFLSFACFARALACLLVCECMRACLRALSDWGLCRHEKYHSGCGARATECRRCCAVVQHDAHLASICRRAETAGFG